MANEQNLKTRQLSTEEATKMGRKGGQASVKARREKKLIRETLETLLTMPLKDGKSVGIDDIKSLAAVKGKNISVQEAMAIAMMQKAMKGDVRAAEWVRDTIGQKQTDNLNLNMNLPVFLEGEDDLEE